MRKLFTLAALFLLSASPVMANEIAQKYVANAEQVGAGRLTFMLWDVYDATLYAPHGKWDTNAPYALTLHYLMELDGADIADRSVEEMQGQGFTNKTKMAEWHTQMRHIFPDVKKGTELTAVFTEKSADFYHNGISIGSIEDPEFSKQFSNIWLSEKTSEPELRKKLLGLS